jgi:hypothetical protein
MSIYKKIASGIAVVGLSLFAAAPALAAFNDVTLSSDMTVTLSALPVDLTMLSGGTMASYVVNTNTLVITMNSGSAVTLQSTSGYTLANDDVAPVTATTCSGTTSILTLTSSVTKTVTITPTFVVACGGGTPSGSGGGGGTVITPVPTATFTSNYTTVTSGQAATLTWSTTNATSVSIDKGVGSVAASGTKAVTPTQSTTYTLTATGSGGTVTKTVAVTVGATSVITPPVVTPPVVTPPVTGAHSAGANIKTSDGTVWMILAGNCRSAYTSAGAFLSYGFNSWTNLVDANSADLSLPVCAKQFIPPQDGQIIVSDRGSDMNTAYFISGGVKHGFVSKAVYDGQGFPMSRLTGPKSVRADISWMTPGSNIEKAAAAHLPGTLVNKDGTILLVGSSSLLGIPDPTTFLSWGYSFDNTVKANAADRAVAVNGVMVGRQAGQLSPQ